MSESAVYPINPPAAHRIADDAEALRVAAQVAAVLQEHAAERDRNREVPAEVVDLFSNSGLWGITVPKEYGGDLHSHAQGFGVVGNPVGGRRVDRINGRFRHG